MLIVQRDAERSVFKVSASRDFVRHFATLAAQHGITLEDTVARALLPSICAVIRAPQRDMEHIDTLVEQKMKRY